MARRSVRSTEIRSSTPPPSTSKVLWSAWSRSNLRVPLQEQCIGKPATASKPTRPTGRTADSHGHLPVDEKPRRSSHQRAHHRPRHPHVCRQLRANPGHRSRLRHLKRCDGALRLRRRRQPYEGLKADVQHGPRGYRRLRLRQARASEAAVLPERGHDPVSLPRRRKRNRYPGRPSQPRVLSPRDRREAISTLSRPAASGLCRRLHVSQSIYNRRATIRRRENDRGQEKQLGGGLLRDLYIPCLARFESTATRPTVLVSKRSTLPLPNSPAVSSNALPRFVRSQMTQPSFWPTSRPAASTPPPHGR
jgi:hypothetical protein